MNPPTANPATPVIDVRVREVGPRDGLQSITRTMPTAAKNRWVAALAASGLRTIEVGSFVPPKLLPQMADAAAVVQAARGLPGLTVAALAPNLRGARDALAAGAQELVIPVSATRGQGLANAVAALEAGATALDASLAGLGGCPYAPGATGNIVTEDLVFLLESMGLRTGVDLEKLIAARAVIAAALPGEPLYGHLADAGLPKGFVYAAGRTIT